MSMQSLVPKFKGHKNHRMTMTARHSKIVTSMCFILEDDKDGK